MYALDEYWLSVSARERRFEFAGVEFLQELDETPLSRTIIETEFARFITDVIERLDSDGIQGTPLHERWSAICVLDGDESQFCRWAGRFGLDPFCVSDGDEAVLHSVIVGLAGFEASDLAGVLDWAEIGAEVQHLKVVFDHARAASGKVTANLRHAREECLNLPELTAAYQQGRWMAATLRKTLHLPSDVQQIPDELLDAVKVPVREEDFGDLQRSIKSVLYSDGTVGGVFAKPARSSQERFVKARTLCEALLPGSAGKTVNGGHSWTQKRNRAFAAELLAPVDGLSKRVSGSRIGSDELQDIADSLDVSTQLVEHQLDNAGICTVASN